MATNVGRTGDHGESGFLAVNRGLSGLAPLLALFRALSSAQYAARVSSAAVVIAPWSNDPACFDSDADLVGAIVRAALCSIDDVVVVVNDEKMEKVLPEQVTILLEERDDRTTGSGLRVGVDWCARFGYEAVVVAAVDGKVPFAKGSKSPKGVSMRPMGKSAEAPDADIDLRTQPGAWTMMDRAQRTSVAIGCLGGKRMSFYRLAASIWALLPLDGQVESLWRAYPELVSEVDLADCSIAKPTL